MYVTTLSYIHVITFSVEVLHIDNLCIRNEQFRPYDHPSLFTFFYVSLNTKRSYTGRFLFGEAYFL